MPNAYISGTGGYVPPRVVTNDDLRTQYGIDTTHEWILQRTGIEERRYSEVGVATSDLALHATHQALERAQLKAHDLDMILFASLSPDMHFPGTGPILQKKLGLTEGPTIPLLLAEAEGSGRLKRGHKVALVAFGAGFTWGAAILDW